MCSFFFGGKLLCVGVRRGYASDLRLNVVRLTATEAFLDDGSVPEDIDGSPTRVFCFFFSLAFYQTSPLYYYLGLATVLPNREAMEVVCVTPLDKEAILVAHDSVVQIVDMQGQATKVRSMKSSSPFKFNFRIEAVGKYIQIHLKLDKTISLPCIFLFSSLFI